MNINFPHYKQDDPRSCGLICIKIIAKYHNKIVDVSIYKSYLKSNGISIYDLCKIAENIGFHSGAYNASSKEIEVIDLPVIIHWDENHYVVLFKIRRGIYYISNPSGNIERYSKEQFQEHYFQNNSLTGKVISISPSESFEEDKNRKANALSALEFLIDHLKPYKSRLYQLFGVMVLISLIYASLPFITRSIIDVGIEGNDLNFITVILIANVSLLLFKSIGEWIRSTISLHIASRIKISIVTDYLSKIFSLPISFVENNLLGDIIQRSNDQERIQQFISNSLVSVVMGLLLLLVYGVILFIFDGSLFWIFLVGTILYVWWVAIFFGIRKKMDLKYYKLKGENQSSWIEILKSFEDIKLNNYALLKRWKWEKIQGSLYKIGIKLLNVDRAQQLGADFINGLKDIALTFYGAYLVIEGQMSLGTLISIQFIIGQLANPILEIINFIKYSQSAYISFLRINDINQAKNEQDPNVSLIRAFRKEGDNSIFFKNISFRYEGSRKPTLFNLNFKIKENKITAIVGASGSGKSTTLKLLNKVYDNYSGEIFIGNENLKNYDNFFLRKQTGYVLQNSNLYKDSILHNIVMSEEKKYTPKLVEKVLSWVNLSAEIQDQFSDGIQTQLKEGGEGLSQGQKQRLLLARALFKRPKYLILDEFTNAIDAVSEKKIIELFSKGLKNQTIIMVSHKISTVKCADEIIVLDGGKVVEIGTYKDLVQNKNHFYKLFESSLIQEKRIPEYEQPKI